MASRTASSGASSAAAAAGGPPLLFLRVEVRRVRAGALLLVTALWAGLLLGWLQLTPLYRAADEPTHVDLVLRLADGGSYAAPGTLDVDPRVRASFPLAGLSSAERPELAALYPLPYATTDVPPRDVPFDELPSDPGLTPFANQMTQHPPLYYLLLAGATHVLPGFDGWSFPHQLGALRLVSALLLLPLPALAAAGARRLGAAPPVQLTAALLPLAVPQLAHVGGSVNNDALLVLLGAAAALPLLAVSRGDVTRRTAVVVGVLLGLALLTKAWAIGLVAWAGLAYGLALLGSARDRRGRALTSGLLAGGLAMVVGGWWWVANVVRFGALQPQGMDLLPARDVDRDLVAFTAGMLKRLTASTWGNFGWLEVQLAEPVRVAAALVVVLGLASAVARRSEVPWARAASGVALAALCVQFAVVYQQSLKNYLRGGYFAGLQGRYLYSFVAVVAVLVAVGLSRLLPARTRHLAPLLALGAVRRPAGGGRAHGAARLLGAGRPGTAHRAGGAGGLGAVRPGGDGRRRAGRRRGGGRAAARTRAGPAAAGAAAGAAGAAVDRADGARRHVLSRRTTARP